MLYKWTNKKSFVLYLILTVNKLIKLVEWLFSFHLAVLSNRFGIQAFCDMYTTHATICLMSFDIVVLRLFVIPLSQILYLILVFALSFRDGLQRAK